LSSKVAGEMCERKGLPNPLVALGCWAKRLKNKKNRIAIRKVKNFIKEN
jgi:lipoprotein